MPHCNLLTRLLIVYFVASGAFAAEDFEFQSKVMAPMRDGVQLAANIFIPKGPGPFPVILIRSPYGRGDEKHPEGTFYGARGYVVVVQDCRGRGDSEGKFVPFVVDEADGFDTQEWIGAQWWCNGRIGTTGGSYLGFTQWISATRPSRYLKAINPSVPLSDAHAMLYPGGVFRLGLSTVWGSMITLPPEVLKKPDWPKAFRYLPLRRWDEAIGNEVLCLREWIAHPLFDDYWRQRGTQEQLQEVPVPSLSVGGWYDVFASSMLADFSRLRQGASDPAMRRNHLLIMGPWWHAITPGTTKVGQLDFGEGAKLDLQNLLLSWFDLWLKKSKNTGVEEWPSLLIFVMGENRWRGEDQWPLKDTRFTKFFLHGGGKANSLNGDGVLSTVLPGEEPPDRYVYDPDDATPTLGGPILFSGGPGPADQTAVEQRNDVLVYTSEVLRDPIEVTGPIKLRLHVSSSAKDTDFTGKLVDVHPDGKAIILTHGIVRARYRESLKREKLLEPGRIYLLEIDLGATANVFLTGHRIRLEVASANFPEFDRNPNSGKPFGTDTKVIKADQTVFHDGVRPSHLLLPVVERGASSVNKVVSEVTCQ